MLLIRLTFQSIMSAIKRFNPIRLVDTRSVIQFRQYKTQLRIIGNVESVNHPKIVKRWMTTQSPALSTITPVFKIAPTYGNKIAIKDEFGEYTYQQLYNGAAKISIEISKICGWSLLCNFTLSLEIKLRFSCR